MSDREVLLDGIKPEEGNWDGYGAARTTDAAVNQARLVVLNLFDWDDPEFVPPDSMPSTDGGWLFEWGQQPVMIEIPPEGAPMNIWVGPISDNAGEAEDGTWPASSPLESAWGIIANAYGGDWSSAPDEWRKAAERWRDEVWHPSLPTSDIAGETS